MKCRGELHEKVKQGENTSINVKLEHSVGLKGHFRSFEVGFCLKVIGAFRAESRPD